MTSLPPKPMHNFFPLRFSPPPPPSSNERRHMIEMAAYLRAEKRNFAPGHEVEDWVLAEAEVDLQLARVKELAGIAIENDRRV